MDLLYLELQMSLHQVENPVNRTEFLKDLKKESSEEDNPVKYISRKTVRLSIEDVAKNDFILDRKDLYK